MLLSDVYSYVKSFSVPMLCPLSRCTRSCEGAPPGHLTKLAKGMFHTTGSHAQCTKCRELSRRCQSLLQDGMGTRQQAVSNCIVHPLFLLDFSFLPCSFLYAKIIIIILFTFFSSIKLFSSQPTSFTVFLNLFTIPAAPKAGSPEGQGR